MKILIIKLPAGEQISSLSYNIDSGEVVIGQETSCQITLPDQRQKVARRHARFYKEGEQWFLECLGDHELTVNQTTVSAQRILLSDGDLISLGDYQMVISHFEPWQNTQKLSIKPPSLPSAEDLAPEFCVIPDKEDIQASGKINDPFDHSEVTMDMEEISAPGEDFTDLSMSPQDRFKELQPANRLIDVLAPQPEIDNDWSIHRELWSGETEDSTANSVASPSCSIPVLSDRVTPVNQHKKSVCHAMLDALEQTLEDLSPENLEARFPDHTSGRIRRYFGKKKQQNGTPDFRQQYQNFHQQLMDDPGYRLLFLQRFRQAMKKQETH